MPFYKDIYFSRSVPSEISDIITTNYPTVHCSGCVECSETWAEVFKKEGVSGEMHSGFFREDWESEAYGHTWLVLWVSKGNSILFDPTYSQFDIKPERWNYVEDQVTDFDYM